MKKVRQPTQFSKRCMFCGSAEKRTKEHLWGRWLRDFHSFPMNPTDRGKHTITRFDRSRGSIKAAGHFSNSGSHLSETTKVVCRKCNNEWMSRVEEGMKNLYGIYFTQERFKIPADICDSIRSWAYLKLSLLMRALDYSANMRFEDSIKKAVSMGVANSLEQDWREFFMNRKTPSNLSVFVGKLITETAHSGSHNFLYQIDTTAEGEYKLRYGCVIFFGTMGLVIANDRKCENQFSSYLQKERFRKQFSKLELGKDVQFFGAQRLLASELDNELTNWAIGAGFDKPRAFGDMLE